jgi:hypothetical protein
VALIPNTVVYVAECRSCAGRPPFDHVHILIQIHQISVDRLNCDGSLPLLTLRPVSLT